jgi:16S rRNA (cytidine1402-2'-O)-methyltransferase
MSETIPNRKICIAREITKKFEEFIRGTAKEIYNKLRNKTIKGEITIIINKT